MKDDSLFKQEQCQEIDEKLLEGLNRVGSGRKYWEGASLASFPDLVTHSTDATSLVVGTRQTEQSTMNSFCIKQSNHLNYLKTMLTIFTFHYPAQV